MRYTLLGNSGLRVSEVALGTMTFGTDWGWGASKSESAKQFELFAKAGGNHRKNLLRSLDASLRRLRTDYVEVLWLHAWDYLTPPEEVMRALDDQVRLGKVFYLGVSDTPAWVVAQMQTLAAERGWAPFAGLQIEYSLVQREVERELTPMASGLGLGVLAWSPLGGGVLSGKYSDTAGGGERRLTDIDPARLAVAEAVAAVAAERGVTPSQVALAWLRAQRVIPILGARTAAQLATNLDFLDVELTADELTRLGESSRVPRGFPHDFLAGADYTLGGMSGRLDMPPGRSRYG